MLVLGWTGTRNDAVGVLGEGLGRVGSSIAGSKSSYVRSESGMYKSPNPEGLPEKGSLGRFEELLAGVMREMELAVMTERDVDVEADFAVGKGG